MRFKALLIYSLSLLSLASYGQSFVPLSLPNDLLPAAETDYGNGMSLADFNGDGWPDLTVCRHGAPTSFFENIVGEFSQVFYNMPTYFKTRHFNWVDIDNDGDLDACITSEEGYIKIFEQTEPELFVDVTALTGILDTPAEFYSNSWGDYDGDGLLDLYLPVYEMDPTGEVNALYHNLGGFVFENIAPTSPVNDGQEASFIGAFVDVDNDVDPDLFVINDRDASFNHLYQNNDGVFSDVSLSSGLEHNFFPMTCTVGDYDNNGALDFFMTNNPVTNFFLMANNGDGTFENVSEEAGIQGAAFGWGANFFDYDNDGWLDLHVNTMPFWSMIGQNYLFHNNGDGTFEDVSEASGTTEDPSVTYCGVIGDINNDGKQDFVTYSDLPFGLQVWINESEAGNFLKVTPSGVYSNSQAVGTRIEAYTEGQMQIRYTLCGESFLAQNSQAMHFGIGEAEMVDSLKVVYPSGLIDWYYDIPANTTMLVEEGETNSFVIGVEGQTTICPGDSVVIGTLNGATALWNTGESAAHITVTEGGDYFASQAINDMVSLVSDTVTIIVEPYPEYGFDFVQATCTYDSSYVTITPAPDTDYVLTWENGLTLGWATASLDTGTYALSISTPSGCLSTESFDVLPTYGLYTGYTAYPPTCNGDDNGQIQFDLGPSLTAQVEWFGLNPDNFAAGTYSAFVWDEMGCSEWVDVVVLEFPALDVAVETIDVSCFGLDDGQAMTTSSGGAGALMVDWGSSDNTNLAAGDYQVSVTDSLGCNVLEDFTIEQPDLLDVSFDAGEMSDGNFAMDATPVGGTPPYTFVWTDGTQTWNEEDPSLPISTGYEVVVEDANGCTVSLTYLGVDGSLDPLSMLRLWPNPASHVIEVTGGQPAEKWEITNAAGQVVLEGVFVGNTLTLELGTLSAGLYCLRTLSDGQLIDLRFSKL